MSRDMTLDFAANGGWEDGHVIMGPADLKLDFAYNAASPLGDLCPKGIGQTKEQSLGI